MNNICNCCCCNDNSPSVCERIAKINDNAENIDTNLASAKCNLLNLVKSMCSECRCITQEEKQLLLALESNLNSISCETQNIKRNTRSLDNTLC